MMYEWWAAAVILGGLTVGVVLNVLFEAFRAKFK